MPSWLKEELKTKTSISLVEQRQGLKTMVDRGSKTQFGQWKSHKQPQFYSIKEPIMGKKRSTTTATERPKVGKSAAHVAHDATVDEKLASSTVEKGASKRPEKESRKPYATHSVEYGTLSVGDLTARLGVKIPAEDLDVADAFDLFVGKRLRVRCSIKPSGEAKGQTHMLDDLHDSFTAVADVKRFGASSKSISTGLTFSVKDIETFNLTRFAKRSGLLEIFDIEKLADGDINSDDDEINF